MIKEKIVLALILFVFLIVPTGCNRAINYSVLSAEDSKIADHTIMRKLYDQEIPESAIQDAIDSLHIGYGHTSHGSQITSGMSGLVQFATDNFNSYEDNLFEWSHHDTGSLHLFEGSGYSDGYLDHDCGYSGWDNKTRTFLNENPGFNVIMWSWCGQVNDVDINSHYLNRMAALEVEYPQVVFIYMTGHLEGGSDNSSDNSVLRANNAIREYCLTNGKWLFDFADIEKYNLEGDYFGDKFVNDDCSYMIEGARVGNWATEWRSTRRINQDWYDCGAAHSDSVNANQKAYAVWWLWARIAGWE